MAGPAADHGDEGLGDEGTAHGGHHAGERRQQRPGQARQRRADRKGDGVDPARADAQGVGHFGLLHGAACDQAPGGAQQHPADGQCQHHRHRDDHQRVAADRIGADAEAAQRRRHADRGVAGDRRDDAHQQQRQAPGGQHGVDHAAVEPADHQPLQHHTDQPHRHRRDDEHRQPEVEAQPVGGDGGVGAQHHEFAMRQVDHLHHAEDDGQAGRNDDQAGHRVQHLDQDNSSKVHENTPGRNSSSSRRRGTGFAGPLAGPAGRAGPVARLLARHGRPTGSAMSGLGPPGGARRRRFGGGPTP